MEPKVFVRAWYRTVTIQSTPSQAIGFILPSVIGVVSLAKGRWGLEPPGRVTTYGGAERMLFRSGGLGPAV